MHKLNSEIFWTVIQRLRTQRNTVRPLVHCITNFVTANDCANAILAAGARPCMANSPSECAEVTSCAKALLLNMGTFSEETFQAMLLSGQAANKNHLPVILDPVGVYSTNFRRESARGLLNSISFSVIKGNLREMLCIAGEQEQEHMSPEHLDRIVRTAAEKTGAVCVLTGETDRISDGKNNCRINNGTPELAGITGTGCMTGALIAAFSTAASPLDAAVCGVSIMNLCGEAAAEHFKGTGSFRAELIDLMSQITQEQFLTRLNIYEP